MRFKSAQTGGYRVFAVTGTNTVSFAIDPGDADTDGLLGFAIERHDPKGDERYYLYGFKVFQSVMRWPGPESYVSTYDQPIQSFVWDDFTGKPERTYEYVFHPIKGKPRKLDRSAKPVSITVRTEPLFSKQAHDVFFNRGVASSQAYSRRFDNTKPDQLQTPARRKEALEWLSRSLDEAILKFIRAAKAGDALLCCFYEFRYAPVVSELAKAREKGVDVRVIIDAKDNGTESEESFPREINLRAISNANFPLANVIRREAKPNDIAHNKFMVLLKGATKRTPAEVWTGSTNLSEGGIHGQTNVGHWVRNGDVAGRFKAYWDLLSTDPGPTADDPEARAKNKKLREAVEQLTQVPENIEDFPVGTTSIFSPRSGRSVLDLYARMLDQPHRLGCITLAFGIGEVFKERLQKHDAESPMTFILLERQDKADSGDTEKFIELDHRHNVYEAWGSYLRDPLYQWTRETNARALGLNQHVSYIHSKFLLMDPLSEDPIVVTGSANFSKASTNDNDENMLVIRGDQRVADIYFTEFNRLFNHYYFRSVQEVTRLLEPDGVPRDEGTLFLAENDSWLQKYEPGQLRRKRVDVLASMSGFAAKT
jgi:phosphatidylserine/phosphatidylglycerophosphate/cardiolipin synthase-like enzyme